MSHVRAYHVESDSEEWIGPLDPGWASRVASGLAMTGCQTRVYTDAEIDRMENG